MTLFVIEIDNPEVEEQDIIDLIQATGDVSVVSIFEVEE